jgi:hypothetical protein
LKNLTIALLTISCLLSGENASGQVIRKKYKLDKTPYRYYVLPATDTLKGILVLFPGRGETPQRVFVKTPIPSVLRMKGYLTIVPEFHYSLFADDLIKKQLREILRLEAENHTIDLVLGGYSAGGSVAISYAENLLSHNTPYNLRCVFAIDPPLDLQRIYVTSRRWMNYNCDNLIADGEQTINYLHRALGGSPEDRYENYVSLSPFHANESNGGNAKWLREIPIRLYTEPDLDFVKDRFCQELTLDDLNVTDLEKLNQLLKASGNADCEYIVTKGKGYHSWMIVDPADLAEWIVKFSDK